LKGIAHRDDVIDAEPVTFLLIISSKSPGLAATTSTVPLLQGRVDHKEKPNLPLPVTVVVR
jgi:hypothetical protein